MESVNILLQKVGENMFSPQRLSEPRTERGLGSGVSGQPAAAGRTGLCRWPRLGRLLRSTALRSVPLRARL